MSGGDLTLHLWTPQPNPSPLPMSSVTFRAPATSVTLTSTVEHGHESLAVGLPVERGELLVPAWLPREALEWRDLGHVTLSDGARALFAGRLTEPVFAPGGWLGGVTAHGYWDLLDREIYTDSTTRTLTSADAIMAALGAESTTSWITRGSASYWSDPGISFAMTDLTNSSLADIVGQVVKAGGTDGSQWDCQLWADGPRGVVAHLVSRARPSFAAARYTEPWDGLVDLSYDAREIVTHVRVRYTVSGVATYTDWYPALTDTSVQDRLGIPRQRVQLDGGNLTATLAAQYATAYWTEHSRRRWSGTVERVGGLRRTRGLVEPGRSVRAGEWLHIEGLHPNDGPLLIHGTEWTGEGDRLTVRVGPGVTDLESLKRREHDYLIAGARDRSVTTGARR